MTTVDRKIETKVMRTVSPGRNNFRNSQQNLAEFDSNLDYLLEDLQNSVSRPGSSLGYSHTPRAVNTLDSTRSNSLNRYTSSKSANPMEYSSDDAYTYTSPDGRKHVSGFKKESYSYKTSGGAPPEKSRVQNSINQLDNLLDDLQQVKSSSTFDSYNNTGADPDSQGNRISKRSVQRELHYGDAPRSSSRNRTLERTEQGYMSEGTYGDIRHVRTSSPSPSSRTSTLSKQTKVTNVHSYPIETVQTTTPDINPEILAHLDPNLHPPGNTKVTTTIKTYTYEIPGAGTYPTDLGLDSLDTTTEKYVYSPNTSQTTPSKSFVYNKIENKSAQNSVSYSQPLYQRPTTPSGHTIVKETVTTRNYQPGYSPELEPPSSNQTYLYNETVSTQNIEDEYNDARRKLPRHDTYIKEIHETHDSTNMFNERYPPPPTQKTYIKEIDSSTVNTFSERYPPPTQKTYIKEIDSSTVNTHHTYPNGYPPNDPQNKTVIYKHESHTTNNYGGPGGKRPKDVETFEPKPYKQPPPIEPINFEYKYKSESKTTNNYKAGYPPYNDQHHGPEIQLPPKFPSDNHHPDGPPKRLDELMANIGHEPPNSPYNSGYNAHENELTQRKKIESLKQQQSEVDDLQKKEPVPRSKNMAGPPVYYPPGHEMFAKKEEGGGAWRAEGAYGKESGKYKYEAESKSKEKSRSGAAIVPVCLPLCCGLPCTII